MTLGNFLDLRGLTFDISYHGRIIPFTGGLWLKWSPCHQVNNAKIAILNNYNHLQFQHKLPQVCEEPKPGHEVSTTFIQFILSAYAHPLEHLPRPWCRGN
jgi:hypothetical protein